MKGTRQLPFVRNSTVNVLKEALFGAIERAHDLATRSPPSNRPARIRRLTAIERAGRQIEALAITMQLIEQLERRE
jgi:hypothetical protein